MHPFRDATCDDSRHILGVQNGPIVHSLTTQSAAE